jgi:hypothetical protein
MSEMNDADYRNAVSRLPKWAQRVIEDRDRQIAQLTRRVTELSEGPADSDVIEHDYVNPDRPLGKGVIIRFLFPGEEYIEIRHQREGRGFLELTGTGRTKGSQALAVQPRGAANSLRVRLTEYW